MFRPRPRITSRQALGSVFGSRQKLAKKIFLVEPEDGEEFMFKQAILLAVFLSVASLQSARAQSDERKFEVGGQFSLLQLSTPTITTEICPAGRICFDLLMTVAQGRQTEPGFGGRIGYNFSRYLALEAEGNFFLRDRALDDGRKVQGLFGPKVGKRFDTFGLFAKARPGFMRFSKGDLEEKPGTVCAATFPPSAGCFQPVSKTRFAIDLGGVAEWYPSKNTIVRFDAGDTIIRFDRRNVTATDISPQGNTSLVVVSAPAETKHNFQASVGIGYRF